MKALLGLLLFASTAAYADEPDGTVTLPEGGIGVAAEVNTTVRNIEARPPVIVGVHSTSEALTLASSIGITSDVTAGASYEVELHDPDGSFPANGRWRGPLLAHVELALRHGPSVFVTVGGDVLVDLDDTTDRVVHLGVAASVRLSPLFAVFTGEILPNGPVGQQLAIQVASDAPITLALPAGLLVRPDLPLYGFVETTLAQLAIAHASSTFIISDFLPVEAGVFYRARSDFDVGVTFQDDLENAGDVYVFGITARYLKH